ncbi:hypothetical protein AAFC00_005653 [Neodothiora populina]|uniref:FAD-binding domain-containing protein n=1 Tax=Neodothiora populina TaxID=2781224 RepID=A0ABR3PLW6_9PEZI
MRVLISGAGIAGPTLAFFLRRIGAHVTIVEKSPSLLPHGQNVDIQGSAISAIKKMGLIDQVRRLNTGEKGTHIIGQNGQPFASFPVMEGCSASPSSEFEILRGDLAAVLYDATKDQPNTDYLFDATIREVISNADDSVGVALSNGETRDFDLLVAADGQWSKVRKQCFPSESISVVETGMYAVYWTIPRLPSDNDWWNVYVALKSRVVTVRPDPHGTMRAMFTCMPSSPAQKRAWLEASKGGRQMQEDLLKREFSDAGWQTKRLLASMDQVADFYFQHVQQIKMTRWSRSRVICLGDAAYAPTPLTGMGTSLAIIGAYVLAGELSRLDHGAHPSRALEAYERTFRPFVERIQDIPFFIPGVMHPQASWKRKILQTCIWSISKLVSFEWLMDRLPSPEDHDEGFSLPYYPALESQLERCQ